jgi:hypothetical protein
MLSKINPNFVDNINGFSKSAIRPIGKAAFENSM